MGVKGEVGVSGDSGGADVADAGDDSPSLTIFSLI